MALGIEVMLKSFGVDPAAIKLQAEELTKGLRRFAESLTRVERNQAMLVETLERQQQILNDIQHRMVSIQSGDYRSPWPVNPENLQLPAPVGDE